MELSNQKTLGDQSPAIIGDGNSVSYGARLRLGNESATILKIISLIPQVAASEGVGNEEVDYTRDLQKKVDERFAASKDQLRSRYVDLQLLYGDAYQVAKRNSGLDDFRLHECYNHLRNLSIKVLEEKGGDPISALETLCEQFKKHFATSDGPDFSEQAVEYFLLRELIECNVFPNIEV